MEEFQNGLTFGVPTHDVERLQLVGDGGAQLHCDSQVSERGRGHDGCLNTLNTLVSLSNKIPM